MTAHSRKSAWFSGRALGLAGLLAALLPGAALPATLVMGAIQSDPQSIYGKLKPMAEYVAERLGDVGIEDVQVVIVEDHRQMVALLKDGRVDWISETPYSAVYLQQAASIEFLARKWKDGVPSYSSLIVARRDSNVADLSALTGSRVAFQHPGSTTGYFLPAMAIKEAGMALLPLATPRDAAVPGSVGFVFSGNDQNTITWVHKRIVEAGVISSVDWQADTTMAPAFRRDLKVVFRTDTVPRALELVRADLPAHLKHALKAVLLNMHKDPAARDALSAYHNTSRFDALDAEALASLNHIRAVVGSFGEIVQLDIKAVAE